MKVYIAGPMTGIPAFNIPAFDDLTAFLRKHGFEVVSPAELDDPDTRVIALASPDGAPGSGSANGETWGDFLSRDVKLIADGGIEGIVVLPGWETSRGARLETFVGALKGIPIMEGRALVMVGINRLLEAWATALLPPRTTAFVPPATKDCDCA